MVRGTLLVVAAVSVAIVGCKRERTSTSDAGAKHDTVAGDREAKEIPKLADGDLLARARRSPECGSLEPAPCDDVEIGAVRCELARRVRDSHPVRAELLRDAKSPDRKLRGAALRVLADVNDPPSVEAIHDALHDADTTVACRAAAYAIWLRKSDRARLDELATKCDGAPVIRATSEALEKGTGDVVQVGVSCDDLRAAGR